MSLNSEKNFYVPVPFLIFWWAYVDVWQTSYQVVHPEWVNVWSFFLDPVCWILISDFLCTATTGLILYHTCNVLLTFLFLSSLPGLYITSQRPLFVFRFAHFTKKDLAIKEIYRRTIIFNMSLWTGRRSSGRQHATLRCENCGIAFSGEVEQITVGEFTQKMFVLVLGFGICSLLAYLMINVMFTPIWRPSV